jgi:hypothetical protein
VAQKINTRTVNCSGVYKVIFRTYFILGLTQESFREKGFEVAELNSLGEDHF